MELDHTLMLRAGELAEDYNLRGYDSVRCAGAELLAGAHTVAASGDRTLLVAWNNLGVATFPVGN